MLFFIYLFCIVYDLKAIIFEIKLNIGVSCSKAKNVLTVLVKVALQAISLTGFFYCQVIPTPRPDGAPILNVLS